MSPTPAEDDEERHTHHVNFYATRSAFDRIESMRSATRESRSVFLRRLLVAALNSEEARVAEEVMS